jgi:hypothetical protein
MITVIDNTNPMVTCPSAISVECVGLVPAADISLVVASDNCGVVTVTHVGDGPLVGGACGGTITRTYRGTDPCGNFAECTQIITVDDNTPPEIISCPRDTTLCDPVPQCADGIGLVVATDNCDANPAIACDSTDDGGAGTILDPLTITYTYTVTDDCGNEASCEWVVTVACIDTCPIQLSLDTVHVLNGMQAIMPITIETGVEIGGFDILICYDVTALTPLSVSVGDAIDEWEYFTYRLSGRGNCGTGCPTGLIRIVAIADLDNGANVHPSEPAFMPDGTIAEIVFQVTSDRNFIHQCIPVSFCWIDCTDNIVSSRSGDTSFIEMGTVFDTCQSNPKGDPVPGICFQNGRICIDEPLDDRGDLNLNAIANEVGDAVLFTNYFIYGSSVWNPVWENIQILASDVNDDGIVLTVADLIYLIRIITGDEQAFPPGGHPKMSPYANSGTASMRIDDNRVTVSTSSLVELGGAFLVFRYSGLSVGEAGLLDGGTGMNVRSHANAGELRVLIHPSWDGDRATIGAGYQDVLSIPTSGDGSIELVEVQLSDARGSLLSTSMAKSVVPTEYVLLQNYPNPFNAGTIISFNLKETSEWTVTVYNVLGQIVRAFDGTDDASNVRVPWDGRDHDGSAVPSGVYFYRVATPDWNATRKMALIR